MNFKKILIFIFLFSILPIHAQNWELEDGLKLFKENKTKEAQKFFEGFIKTYPNNPEGYYTLGLIYKNQNNLLKSANYLEKSYNLTNSTIDIKIAPDIEGLPFEDYLDMAQMYYEVDRLKDALVYIELIEKINPDNAKAHYLKCEIYYKQAREDLALTYFLKALENDNSLLKSDFAKIFNIEEVPEFNDGFYNSKGLQYFYAGNFEKSKQYFEKALEKNPKNAEAYNNLGIIYSKLNNLEMSEKNFKKALKYNKNLSVAYLNLINITNNKIQKDWYLKKILKINPNEKVAYYIMGKDFIKEKNYEKAIKYFKTALQIDDKYEEAYLALVSCYIEMGNTDEALLALRDILQKEKNNPEVFYYLAKLCKDKDEAISYLKEAIKIAPNPQYYIDLSELYLQKNNRNEALAIIKEGIQELPSSETLKNARAKF